MREISFCDALNEAIFQSMERDSSIIIYGIGVPDHKKIFGTTSRLLEKFGQDRVFDTPLSEDTMAGFGLGAAINGLKPIHVHIRVDFLLLAMNQLTNLISSYNYMTDGINVPIVIRAIIGRGWGQGMQHGKSLQSLFAHIPGLKVVMPTMGYDVKGLFNSAIQDPNPVIFLEHRWLYWATDNVPEEYYTLPLGKGLVRKEGKDLTIVATSWMNIEAKRAITILEEAHGLSIELIDPLTISPLDDSIILESVKKTGALLVIDNDWLNCGFSAEVISRVSEKGFNFLRLHPRRIGFAETPCPTVRCLENKFYPNAVSIVREVEDMFLLLQVPIDEFQMYSHENKFKGPF